MEDLIEKNMGLVLTVVNRFNPQSPTDKEAYIQAGRIGLWKALKKFSHTGGSKFSPYAWNPIKWEIIKEIRAITSKQNTISIEVIGVDDHHAISTNTNVPFWELVPATLTPKELKIIELRLEGFNFKEISSKLKCHRSHTKKLFHNAIKKIRDNDE